MQVFKTYFKIFKNCAFTSLIVNLIVVIGVCSIFATIKNDTNSEYKAAKPTITVYNNDESEMTSVLMDYLNEACDIVDTENTKISRQKALFYNNVDMIITINEGFGDDFVSGKNAKLDIECNTELNSTEYSDILINKYLSLFHAYIKSTDLSLKDINALVIEDLSVDTPVRLDDTSIHSHLNSKSMFYNFANYSLTIFLISQIGIMSIVFNKKDLRRRLNCSAVSLTKYNFQIILGDLCITLLSMFIVMAIGIIMFNVDITVADGYLHYINIAIFTIVALSISFLISTFASKRSLSPIGNVITLGTCFLGGSFVPQEFLGDKIALTAVINPVWWYVKASNTISSVSVYNFITLRPAITSMAIQLLFAVVFFMIALLIQKRKRTQD